MGEENGMHIVYMNGGLGNQLFQFMFYRWLRKVMPTADIVIDDSKFWGDDVPHHGYEIKRIFGLDLPLLSSRFTADVWNYMLTARQHGKSIAEQLSINGLNICMVREKGLRNTDFHGIVQDFGPGDQLEININDNIYWYGFWLSNFFYYHATEEITQDIKFPVFMDQSNLQLQEMIKNASEPTAIHVRRGDMAKAGWTASPEYYKQLIYSLDKVREVSLYLLFSDDIQWCEMHTSELGLDMIQDRLIVVDNNRAENYWRDLQLMSLCKNRISDRSSFSLLAGLLCQYPQKIDLNRFLGCWKE